MLDALNGLFETYGYYQEALNSYVLPGKDGVMKISALMDHLRGNTSNQICGRQILAVEDYLNLLRKSDSGVEEIHLPKSNVLRYELDNDAWLAVRPSGTEPKLKIYFGVKGASASDCETQLKALKEQADRLIR